MQFSGSVVRWRRQMVANPYNPEEFVPGPWAEASKVTLSGAAVLSTSAYALRSEGRLQALAAKSLFLDDPAADVQRLDGISLAAGGDEPEFVVEVVPNVDVNPFTEWAPVRECPLKGARG